MWAVTPSSWHFKIRYQSNLVSFGFVTCSVCEHDTEKVVLIFLFFFFYFLHSNFSLSFETSDVVMTGLELVM